MRTISRFRTSPHVNTELTSSEPIRDFINVQTNRRRSQGDHLLSQTLLHYGRTGTKNARSQPTRTDKDRRLKYAQHEDPRKVNRECGDSQGDNRNRAPNAGEQRKAGTQQTDARGAGASRPVPIHGRNTEPCAVTTTTLLSLSSACTRLHVASDQICTERHFTMRAYVLPCAHYLSCETFVPEVGSPSHSFGPLSPWGLFTRINVQMRD